ncbi:MAG: spondin domain-containing protein [Polyangiaceae bacterium]
MFGNATTFFAPEGGGIPLFDEEGMAIASQDVTSAVLLWDAGTEVNQAPNSGPLQAPRQGTPDTGPAEGRLTAFGDSTRALPSAWQVARVSVAKAGDGFDVTVANVSGPGSSVATAISPVFYALHNENWSLFQPNSAASAGIEAISEDGNSAVLVAEEAGKPGVAMAAAATVPVGADAAGAAKPGQMYTFHVTPSATARYLSVATMFGQSNDAFLGFGPEGVELADEQGAPRSEADVNADLERKLVLWDAGTEENQVPGAGGFTGPFQPAPNTGPADSIPGVRRYGDATNDLAGPRAGGVLEVKVTPGEGNDLPVTVTHTSAETAYPTKLSPLVFAVHDGVTDLFAADAAAPAYVERLAEDGNPSDWGAALNGAAGVADSGTVGDKPIEPGESWTFTISVTPDARVLGLATMVATSNDTFVSLGPKGVELADTQGDPRPLADINADLAAALGAWDAGTEANQAAALGPDQAPRQAAPNSGPAEGDGTVRAVDQVWAFPPVADVMRVTVTRIEE